ncbi:ParB/RepB/Spo0J family partition protein [Veillonella sp.]|uniref:ParB/RepB/Spo0J family partition protein n=1 Tax=Veillonella sp. TaxID=1926307 RepID=UPI0025E93829|nr:ParB/RepB/Spo0J family partition protein [Veillonella sp.]
MPRDSKKKGGLGRGVLSLLPQDEPKTESAATADIDEAGKTGIIELPLIEIEPNPNQPRRHFLEDEMATLVESIRQYGVIQPIVVCKMDDKYQIVAGERRWRAAQLAELTTIPVVIKDYSMEQITEIALVENLQRQDLDPVEEAYAYKRLMDTFKKTQEAIATRLGRSRSHVANMVRLLQLPDFILTELSLGDISIGQARPLLSLKNKELQKEALKLIKEKELTARQVETLVKQMLDGTYGKQAKARKNIQQTAELRAIMDRLKVSLGMPVDIKVKAGNKVQGKMEIAFRSEEELNYLIDYIETQGMGEVEGASPAQTEVDADESASISFHV